ncbi:MAG: adenylate cyclase [Spirochaetae bacterium HGW-Spirochaetae-5]|nr:MAG: adenylate cyclase [Spirochaetae bacterium HGW-Spirochaetae-5]
MSEPTELDLYLKNNPWPEEHYGKTQIDYLYNYNIKMSPDELWPMVSDTSEINRLLGLHKMTFEEKNGRLFGKGKILGFNLEWEEIPWEWESSKEMRTTRIYSKGIISYVRAHLILTETDDNSTNLTLYFGWIPRNLTGYIVLKFADSALKKKYQEIYREFESKKESHISFNITDPSEKKPVPDYSAADKIQTEKLKPIRESLLDHGFESSLIDNLFSYIINSTDEKLYRIRPKELTGIFGVEFEKLISILLYSCKCGLLNLSWDIICPHCRGIREKHEHLWSIEDKSTCDVCDIDFSTGGMNIIEVTFSVNPGIKKVDKVLYCSAEPAKKPHIILQKTLQHGSTYTYSIPDIEKRMRFRTRGEKKYGMLDVERKASIRNLYWDDLNSTPVIKCSPGSTVFINNNDNKEKQFTIEISEDDQWALRPSDLFNFSEFREIFSDETLAYGISIDIGIQNILFIDVVGSTEYYKNSGDTEAFKTIRKYFVKVNDITQLHRGVIVKTIGDAVMLSFQNPVDALKCAIKLISIFDGTDKDVPLACRISINRGSCLAVNLNTLIDYFGQTVNVVSKLQKFTGPGEISITESFTDDASVNSYLRSKNYSFKNIIRADIKGAGEIIFRKIRVKKLPA